ncbi:MAG: hypothetical protein H7A41_02850 [Chlamydiales bacterium]|nr:hypothetical protein [Chlamydiales bacterium]
MGRRRKAFTLIELFLSIGLIALIGSLVLLRAKPMLDHYRMNHSYEKLKREIALSKYLAQTATADIEFQIEQHKKGLICKRKTDEPLSLGGTINTSFVIPYLQLEGSEKETVLITSSGWIENDEIINICLGKQRKTIDARALLD